MSYAKLEGEQDGVVAQDLFVRTVLSYEAQLAEARALLVVVLDFNGYRGNYGLPNKIWEACQKILGFDASYNNPPDNMVVAARAYLAGGAKEGE